MLKTRNIDFLFLVEHEDRELYSVLRIAEQIKGFGATSLILSMEFFGLMAAKLTVQTIVVPFAISSEAWPFKYLLTVFPNAKFISLNWEQLLSEANKDFKRPRDRYIKESVQHLAWSDSYKRFLTESGVIASNVTVIGNPLTQSLLEFVNNGTDLRSQLYEEFNLDNDKQTIFFPMNYGWAFHSDKTIQKKIEQGYDKNVAYEYREYSRRCLERFCFFIKDLLVKSNFNIVIRPHPSISIEQYIEVFERNVKGVAGKIVFTKKYTIKEWITISDIVASSWSTSVWDAANIGKKIFLFTPYDRPTWLNTWWNDLVPNITSVDDINHIDFRADPVENSKVLTIVPRIALWIKEVSDSSSFDQPFKANPMRVLSCYINFYALRCQFRLFSMRFLKAAFVKKGMQRDYFLPVLIE